MIGEFRSATRGSCPRVAAGCWACSSVSRYEVARRCQADHLLVRLCCDEHGTLATHTAPCKRV